MVTIYYRQGERTLFTKHWALTKILMCGYPVMKLPNLRGIQ